MTSKKMILISLMFMTTVNVNAGSEAEKAKLALIIHELETITPLLEEAEALASKSDRIQFQYEWLLRDIEHIKSAIQEHINAPRIQARSFPPLDSNYRL